MRALVIILALCSSVAAAEKKSYAQRVDEFWAWFQTNSAPIHKALQDGSVVNWVDRISARVEAVHPDFAWELRPSPKEGEESFVIYTGMTGTLDLLAKRWLAGAPEVKGWRFLDSLPPIQPHALEIEGKEYKPNQFVIQVRNQPIRTVFDVRIYHPNFAGMDEEAQYRACFIWLDSVLGSRTTPSRIGEIVIATTKPKGDGRTMDKLRDELAKRCKELGWSLDPDPTEAREYSKQIPGAPEGVRAWRVRNLDFAQVVAETEVDFASILLPNDGGKITQQGVDRTRAIEKLLPAALGKNAYVIGVSHGKDEDSIGLMVFDRKAATAALKKLFAEQKGVAAAKLQLRGQEERVVLK